MLGRPAGRALAPCWAQSEKDMNGFRKRRLAPGWLEMLPGALLGALAACWKVWHNAGRFQRRFGTSLASGRRLALVWLEMPPAALREKRQRNLAAWPEQADLPFACMLSYPNFKISTCFASA